MPLPAELPCQPHDVILLLEKTREVAKGKELLENLAGNEDKDANIVFF